MTIVRCLIVDDEELTVQRLRLFFAELAAQGKPYTLAGVAYSGDEGLRQAASLQPDIIITDIMMPVLDGMTMIERMERRRGDTEFIILTAYSDFEYAKRAIRLDVSDYIVKAPLSHEDLLKALDKASMRLQESKRKNERLRKLDMSMLRHRHRVFQQFFQELLRGEIKTEQAMEQVASYDMKLLQGRYICIVMEMDHYTDFIHQYPISDRGILKYGILNVAEETLQAYGSSFACEIDRQRFIAFVEWPLLHSIKENDDRCREIGAAVVHNIRAYLKQSLSVGFSVPGNGWADIAPSYRQALEACAEHYYDGPGTIATPRRRAPNPEESDLREARNKLHAILQQWHKEPDDADTLRKELLQFRREAEKTRPPRQALTALLKTFAVSIRNRIAEWNPDMSVADEDALSHMSLEEQIAFLAGHTGKALTARSLAAGRPDISKAIDYIERHLAERLTLQTIAEQANLAPAYFSGLFKREMKESLIDYINRKKIELSIALLDRGNYTNQELCEAVGIINEAYFCTLFKQKTGSTPGQYRKNRRRRTD